MDHLPTELLNLLCLYLTTASLKSLRLVSKTFADIGEAHLFHDFEFRLFPSHHRLYQLEQLATNAAIASRLRTLSFESGVQLEYSDYKYWAANVYQQISNTWSNTRPSHSNYPEQFEEFHTKLQARFTPDLPARYELLRWHLDQEAAMTAEKRVRNGLLRTMNNLASHVHDLSLKIVMSEPQITLDDLEAFDTTQYEHDTYLDPDPRRRVLHRRQSCLNHFINFLDAANLSHLEVRKFVAVDLPHQMLSIDSIYGFEILNEFFKDLHSVNIKVGEFPLSDWLARGGLHEIYFGGRNLAARKLAKLLNTPSNMEHLDLEFLHGKEAEYSYDIFDRTNIDRFPRLWLPHLKTLHLCRIRCPWADLKALLNEATNVKGLTLSCFRLDTGSMLDLITYLPTMKLQNVELQGSWYVDEDMGEWHSHTTDDFTNCFAATSYEGPYVQNGMRAILHAYMLKGGYCPISAWTPDGGEADEWEVRGDTSWHYLPGRPR